MNDVYQVLKNLNISYTRYNHPAVYTVEEADKYVSPINACHSKNLFVCNKKKTAYYLIIMEAHKKVDLKNIASLIGSDRLSFASSERLLHFLGLTPGAVSPFGLINDKNHEVTAVIDADFIKNDLLGFHPNMNTTTIVINNKDFKKYLTHTGNKILYTTL